MINTPNRTSARSANDEPKYYPLILTLELPSVEEIAKAIWKRQHEALNTHALSYNAQWRDSSIPSRYWDQFLLDARAVLLLLYRTQITPVRKRKKIARKSAAFLGLSPKIDLAGVRAPRAGACAQKPNEEPAPTRERREKRASFTHDRDQAPRTCLATQHKQSQDRPRPNRQENRSALHALSAGELEATQFRRKR
jgi:hypothetical protein